jgi:hypothetical protein
MKNSKVGARMVVPRCKVWPTNFIFEVARPRVKPVLFYSQHSHLFYSSTRISICLSTFSLLHTPLAFFCSLAFNRILFVVHLFYNHQHFHVSKQTPRTMRSSTFFAVAAALMAPAFAAESTVVPVQQIGDGQIQNPATPLPPASSAASSIVVATTSAVATSYAPPPAPPAVSSPASSSAALPAPPVVLPSGGGSLPSYGNVTSTKTGVNTVTQSVIKPSKAPSSTVSGAASPSASKPSVQTGAANTLVGSTIGLGAAALLAAFLG